VSAGRVAGQGSIGESSRQCAQPLKIQGLLRREAGSASRLADMRKGGWMPPCATLHDANSNEGQLGPPAILQEEHSTSGDFRLSIYD
jgi:hypothetical protein